MRGLKPVLVSAQISCLFLPPLKPDPPEQWRPTDTLSGGRPLGVMPPWFVADGSRKALRGAGTRHPCRT